MENQTQNNLKAGTKLAAALLLGIATLSGASAQTVGASPPQASAAPPTLLQMETNAAACIAKGTATDSRQWSVNFAEDGSFLAGVFIRGSRFVVDAVIPEEGEFSDKSALESKIAQGFFFRSTPQSPAQEGADHLTSSVDFNAKQAKLAQTVIRCVGQAGLLAPVLPAGPQMPVVEPKIFLAADPIAAVESSTEACLAQKTGNPVWNIEAINNQVSAMTRTNKGFTRLTIYGDGRPPEVASATSLAPFETQPFSKASPQQKTEIAQLQACVAPTGYFQMVTPWILDPPLPVKAAPIKQAAKPAATAG